MDPYELRLRAEWAALKAEAAGFTNTSNALLEIARIHLPNDLPELKVLPDAQSLKRSDSTSRKGTGSRPALTIC